MVFKAMPMTTRSLSIRATLSSKDGSHRDS